jgi:hypothetical protein
MAAVDLTFAGLVRGRRYSRTTDGIVSTIERVSGAYKVSKGVSEETFTNAFDAVYRFMGHDHCAIL